MHRMELALASLLVLCGLFCSQASARYVGLDLALSQAAAEDAAVGAAADSESEDFDEMELFEQIYADGRKKTVSKDEVMDLMTKAKDEKDGDVPGQQPENEEGRERRTIQGADDRLPVFNENAYPWCAVGYLESGCTATFIGPYHAITAAHCVFDSQTKTYKYNQLNIFRGRHCRFAGQRMVWTSVYAPSGFTVHERWDFDFALITYSPLFPSPCWLGFGYLSVWGNTGFDIVGYPSDKSPGPMNPTCPFNAMWFTSCHYSRPNGLMVEHRCDVLPGNSGSALYGQIVGDPSGKKIVHGVLSGNSDLLNGRPLGDWNVGPRLNKIRVMIIIDAMMRSGYNPILRRLIG